MLKKYIDNALFSRKGWLLTMMQTDGGNVNFVIQPAPAFRAGRTVSVAVTGTIIAQHFVYYE